MYPETVLVSIRCSKRDALLNDMCECLLLDLQYSKYF